MSWKPFIASQRVRLPPGKGTACQPEAYIAWGAVTDVVKGTQQDTASQPSPSARRWRSTTVSTSAAVSMRSSLVSTTSGEMPSGARLSGPIARSQT